MGTGMQTCHGCRHGHHDRCSWGNCKCYATDIEGHEDPQAAKREAYLEAQEDMRAEMEGLDED